MDPWWIKAVPYGLPARYDPPVEDSRWLAAGREFVLGSFGREAIPPFKMTRRGCLEMNERIGRMGGKDELRGRGFQTSGRNFRDAGKRSHLGGI